MGLAGDARANEIDAVGDVIKCIDGVHSNDVGLVVCEIIIGEDSGLDRLAFFDAAVVVDGLVRFSAQDATSLSAPGI